MDATVGLLILRVYGYHMSSACSYLPPTTTFHKPNKYIFISSIDKLLTIYLTVHVYIYIYRERERERELYILLLEPPPINLSLANQ